MSSTCLDGECCLGGRVTNIASSNDIDSKSYYVAMACGDDWKLAAVRCADCALEVEKVLSQREGGTRRIRRVGFRF